jgi:hypothetical protein
MFFNGLSVQHGACPDTCGIVAPIASVSSSKPLMKKPEQVNVIALSGKVAVKRVEAELPPDTSISSRVTNFSMSSEGTTFAQLMSAGARKRSLLPHH